MEREHPSPFVNTDTGLDTDILDLPLVRKPTWKISTLYQTEHWINIRGEVIPLEQIDARYARNIMGFLDKRAAMAHEIARFWLSMQWPDDPSDGVWHAMVASEQDHDNTPPLDWMRSTPLYEALRATIGPLNPNE